MSTFELMDRPCPLCGSVDNSKLFAGARFDPARLDGMSFSSRKAPEGMHYRLLECTSCDLLYASPVPSSETLVEAYREAEYASADEAQYAAATYADVLAEVIPRLPNLGGAVDIGAGDGAFIERLHAAGFDQVVGFEPSSAPLAAAPPAVRAHLRHEPFVAGVLPDEAFSLVSCLQTIEHIPDPLTLCRDAVRALAPSGAILLVCHDRRALSARVLRRRSPIFDVEHLQLFSPRSIRILLERGGFERIEVHSLVNRYPLRYWLRLAPIPERLRRMLYATLGPIRVTEIVVSIGAGNIFAIGYKPGG